MLVRTDYFRIRFSSYQHAYFTVTSKYYRFCLNLLTEWLYYYIKDLDQKSLQEIDYQFRRYGYKNCISNFPQRLFETYYRRLPTEIAQNIFPEALELAKARLSKPQKEYHFKISSFSFTWTNLGKQKDQQVLTFPRSRYLKRLFKDSVLLTIPDKVYKHIQKQSKKFHIRIIFKDGSWWCYVLKKDITPVKSSKKRVFAGIDLNLNDIAYIDEVTKQPVLFSLKQVTYKCLKLFEKSEKLQSQGNIRYKKYLNKISKSYKSILKLYAIRIIQHARSYGINRIAVGNVRRSLKKRELSRRIRKFWNKVPWTYFIDYLTSLGAKYGIYVYTVSEAYTSKCSALSDDIVNRTITGQRITRGLYKTSDGTVIQADVNGAANILKRAGNNFKKVISFNKSQLSAVRRVGYQLLFKVKLHTALFYKKLKDYMNGAGWEFLLVTPLKRCYCCSGSSR